jgi:hypothetical protein
MSLITKIPTTAGQVGAYTKNETDIIASGVSGEVTTHAGLTEAHGATGAVVGTTNTQTITNKTIDLTNNTLVGTLNLTGFVSWGGSGNYYSIVGTTLTLLREATGKIDGKTVTALAGQTVTLTAFATVYVGVDSTGTLIVTTNVSETWYATHFALFQVISDDTQSLCVFENHPAGTLQGEAGGYLHHVLRSVIGLFPGEVNEIGGDITRVTTGTGAVATDRQLKIVGNAMLYDHGVESPILDTAGSPINSYFAYTNAGGNWKAYSQTTTFPMVYNNAGTVTALPSGNYSIMSVYVTKQDPNNGTTYITVIGTGNYSNIGQAQTALANGQVNKATNALAKLEVALLGFVIIRNNVSGGYLDTIKIDKQVAGSAGLGGGVGGSASLTTTVTSSFNNKLSSADSTVQLALETLDDHNHYYDPLLINGQTGTTYTLVLTDKVVEMNNASANTLTIPTNASVAFPVGSQVTIMQTGAGDTLIQADTGVTLNGVSAGSLQLLEAYEGVTMYKKATDTWIAINA